MDNCIRENKIKYVFGSMECLIAWGLFDETYVHSFQLDVRTITLTNHFHAPFNFFEQNNAVYFAELHH